MNTKDGVLPVSIVIPTYNGERYIDEALGSVFAQTRLPSEIIVVDDASTDDTTRCIEAAADSAPVPVNLIRLSRNSGGPARPMNVGIEAARSPLVAVLDQDDVFLPERIESQSNVLVAHPDVAFVFGYIDVKQERNGPAPVELPEKKWGRLRKQMVCNGDLTSCDGIVALRVLINHGNCVGGFPGFTFRRDDWKTIGGIDERLAAAADHDLLCRLCQRGQVAMVPEVHYLHRLHDANLSRQRVLGHTDAIEILAKYANSRAWPTAASEVRQAISKELYALAIQWGLSGFDPVARRLLVNSLLLGSVHPRNLISATNYFIKIFRRRRRMRNIEPDSNELERVVRCLETLSELYQGRFWPGHSKPVETIESRVKEPTIRAHEENHAA